MYHQQQRVIDACSLAEAGCAVQDADAVLTTRDKLKGGEDALILSARAAGPTIGGGPPRAWGASYSTFGFNAVGGWRFAAPEPSTAIRLSTARPAIARRVGMLALPMCGVSTTFGTSSRSG